MRPDGQLFSPSSISGRTLATAGKITSRGPASALSRRNASPKGAIRRFTSLVRLPARPRGRRGPWRCRGVCARLPIEAFHPIELLDQRMADIAAKRAAKPPMRLRLEGQDGEDMIDIAAHLARPARPPRPDARRDIVDDGEMRRPFAHALCDLMGEFGTIEDDEPVGTCAITASTIA